MAELDGEYVNPKTPALLMGGLVDAHFAGETQKFRRENPELFRMDGTLRNEFLRAEEIIRRIERDELAMMMLEGKRQEIVTAEIFGQPFKAKMDVVLDEQQVGRIVDRFPGMDGLLFAEGALVDMKIMRDFKPVYKDGEGRQTFIEAWGQDRQMALYQESWRQKTGKRLPCYILAATKEESPDIGLFEIPQPLMDANMDILAHQIGRIAQVKSGSVDPDGCGQCAVCRAQRVLTAAGWPEEFAG